jgi:hypothetical protein
MNGRTIESCLSTLFLILLLGYGYWIGYSEREALAKCASIISGEVIEIVGSTKRPSLKYYYHVDGKRYEDSESVPRFFKRG